MSTKTKLALAVALILSTSSAVLAAPRHSAYQGQGPAASESWMQDRHDPTDTNGF
jgi:hypothetical protein